MAVNFKYGEIEMTNEQKLKAARKKFKIFPNQIGCIYYKGLRINWDMYFNG